MKKLGIVTLIAGFMFYSGAFTLLCAAPLPDEIDVQAIDISESQEFSEDQVDKAPITTEFKSMGISNSDTQQSTSNVETVKGLIIGFESAGQELTEVVTTLKDLGHSSNDIVLGLISLGHSGKEAYNAIAEAFSPEVADKAVPTALVDTTKEINVNTAAFKDAGLSYASMTDVLVEAGYFYEEIIGALQVSGASAEEVLQILQDAGFGDREIVTVMLDGNFTAQDIVQGMDDQGMSTDEILESFKEESYETTITTRDDYGDDGTTTETIIVDTGIIRKPDEVVAALISAGVSTDEVVTVAKDGDISNANIANGLKAGGLSVKEVFSVMADHGVSESKTQEYLLAGGSNTYELVNAMMDIGKTAGDIFKAFKSEGNQLGEILCVVMINSGNFTKEDVVSAASESGISWDKISLGLKHSGSTISEIIEILQSNELTETEIVNALREDFNFGASSIVIAMNDLGWSMDTIIASFGDGDDAAVVTGLIRAGNSAEEVVIAARGAEISWANITDGLSSTGMDTEEIYTILSDQGLSDTDIVDNMLDSGKDAGIIVAGLINVGMDMNSIFEAFKDKKGAQGKSVVSALAKSGNYTFEEVTAAAEEAGMDTKDIAKGMEFGGSDFAKIVQYLKDNGQSDREVVTTMIDDAGSNVSDMVQGMVDLGWDTASIFNAFKEEPVIRRDDYGDEGTVVTESNVVREEAAVVAALVGAGVSVDEVFSEATEAGMALDPITQGFQQAGVSVDDAFAALISNGASETETVSSMVASGYNAGAIANTMLNNGSDMNQLLNAFTNSGELTNASVLVDSFLTAGFETYTVIATVKEAGASWNEIASGLKTNGFEPLEVLTILINNNLSDPEIVTAMLDGSYAVNNLVGGMESLGWDMSRIIIAFEDAGGAKTVNVIGLLAKDFSTSDVVSSAVDIGVQWSDITQGLQHGGETITSTYSVLSNNGLDNKTIAGLMVDAGFDQAGIVNMMKGQGMSFSDCISTFTNNNSKLIVDMSILINAYKITPA